MELIKTIEDRRSIRKFKDDKVPGELITKLIEAARLAPSGVNIQPARYVVIKSKEARAKLNECTKLSFVVNAPVVIACCVDLQSMNDTQIRVKELIDANAFADTTLESKGKEEKISMDEAAIKAYLNLNVAIAIEHIALRAVDLGLGTCWVMMFNHEKAKKILNLEDKYEIVALLPVGYPDQDPKQRPRLPLNDLILKEI
jgi:nitroreductase